LNTASRSSPSVSAPYSISASTIGRTHVAFGFFTGTASGDVFSQGAESNPNELPCGGLAE
jgi:hypothetical protein